VPAEFQGVWVHAKASCDSPLRLQVGADRLTLRNGHDKGSAQQVRYNAHVSKLDLARRFPVHQAPLKRCAAA
jgi:hypothetical protein